MIDQRVSIEEVRRTVKTALADPARTQERKDFIQSAPRVAESSIDSLYNRLQYPRDIPPEVQAYILRLLTTPARLKKAANDEKRKGEVRELHVGIAAAIRKIAEERKTPLKALLVDGEDFVGKHLVGSVNEKLDKQLPPAKVSDIRAAVRGMKRGAL